MKTFILALLAALISLTASAQTAYQLPSNAELIGYQCSNRVQYKVTGNDGTTQTGIVFAQCAQGGGRGGNIWHNASCATVIWDESGNLLPDASGNLFEVTATASSRTAIPASWCFGS